MNFFNRTFLAGLLALTATSPAAWAQELRLHLDPAQGTPGQTALPYATGSDTPARLLNGALLVEAEGRSIIGLGSQNGYVDLGQTAGQVAGSLSDFTLYMEAYVPNSADLSGAGNFLCTFSHTTDANNSATGCYFLSAHESRYAISRTNWAGEISTPNLGALPKGKWQSIAVLQKGTNLSLYIDGAQVSSISNCSLSPQDLGATAYNWIGRSCYATDSYLKEALIADFRLYDGALSLDSLRSLSRDAEQLNSIRTQLELAYVAQTDLPERVERYTQLPTTAGDATISYASDRPDLISP